MAFDAPGVYIRYVTDGPLTVRAASTSTAVFIGPTIVGRSISASNPAVITPSFVSSSTEYAEQFTTPGCRSGLVCLPGNSGSFTDHMGHALRGFFMNGGQRAYIVSTSTGVQARATLAVQLTLPGATSADYTFSALSDGAWGNDISVEATASPIGASGGYLDLKIELQLKGDSGDPIKVIERFIGLKGDEVAAINSGLVRVTGPGANASNPLKLKIDAAPANPPASATKSLTGGADSLSSQTTDFEAIFQTLPDIDDISIVVLPGSVWPDHQSVYSLALKHCKDKLDRLTLIQLDDATNDFANISVPLDKFAAVYYPSARVTLPTPGGGQRNMTGIGTTGHIAGVYARTDGESGPWTAPAGVRASIAGVTELSRDISQAAQERMNPNCVNALRYIDGVPVVWGARTRDKGGIYEYVPVMRTAFLIADSLRAALNRVVFAKNTEVLWDNVKAGTSGFMDGLFLQGAFQGATPAQAYRVAVGLNQSMTQDDIRKGILRVNLAFAPAFPAEFIEVVIEQIFEPG